MRFKSWHYFNNLSLLLLSQSIINQAIASPVSDNSSHESRHILDVLKPYILDAEVDTQHMSENVKSLILKEMNIKNISDCTSEFLDMNPYCCGNDDEFICTGCGGECICYCNNYNSGDPIEQSTTKKMDWFKDNRREMSSSLIVLSIGISLVFGF